MLVKFSNVYLLVSSWVEYEGSYVDIEFEPPDYIHNWVLDFVKV